MPEGAEWQAITSSRSARQSATTSRREARGRGNVPRRAAGSAWASQGSPRPRWPEDRRPASGSGGIDENLMIVQVKLTWTPVITTHLVEGMALSKRQSRTDKDPAVNALDSRLPLRARERRRVGDCPRHRAAAERSRGCDFPDPLAVPDYTGKLDRRGSFDKREKTRHLPRVRARVENQAKALDVVRVSRIVEHGHAVRVPDTPASPRSSRSRAASADAGSAKSPTVRFASSTAEAPRQGGVGQYAQHLPPDRRSAPPVLRSPQHNTSAAAASAR